LALATAVNNNRTFFVTSVCANRHPLFRDEQNARIFLDVLFGYRKQERFSIHAFVLMPDHFHGVITPGDVISLEKAVQFIKGGSSFRLGKVLPAKTEVWQRGFTLHRIESNEDFSKHVEYVHQNPVRAGLAKRAEEHPYSSAHPGFSVDQPPFSAGAKAPSF
jgi:putative transposase